MMKVNFTKEQAKEQTEAMSEIADVLSNNLSTKTDLDKAEAALKSDIALVRNDIMWIKVGGGILGSVILACLTYLITVTK